MKRFKLRTVSVPLLDTGLGREAGFANDRELIAHGLAQRAALPPAVRQLADTVDARLEHAVLHGEPR